MDPSKSANAVKRVMKSTVEKAAQKALEAVGEIVPPDAPGAPASAPPALEEPTRPRGPLPPKPDQSAPERRTVHRLEPLKPRPRRRWILFGPYGGRPEPPAEGDREEER